MPKYVDESGVRRIWQTAENTFLKSEDAEETYLKTADAENEYLKTADAERIYLDSETAAQEYLRADAADNTFLKAADASTTYLRADDAEETYMKTEDAEAAYLKQEDADDTYLKKEDAEDIYLKTADAGAISEENYTTAEKQKLAGLSNYQLPAASDQQLGGVKVGSGLDVNAEGVLSVTPVEPDVDWEDVNNSPTTLAGYGITDAATKAEINAIRGDIANFYIYRGKVQTLEDLANIQNPANGDTYDVEDSGVNYAWNEAEHRWDSMGGLGNIASMSESELDLLLQIASSREVLLALINEGGTITFDNDISVTEPIVFTEDTVLDLAANTLTSTALGYAITADGANVTLRCGTIVATGCLARAVNGGSITIESGAYGSGAVAFKAIGIGSSVTMQSGSVTGANGCFAAIEGGSITITGGEILCNSSIAVYTEGADGSYTNEITMSGGNITARTSEEGFASCGVCLANKDLFTMTGGRIISKNGCGLLIRDGRAIIRDGIISAEGTGSGWVGSNGTRMSHSAVIFHESALDTHYGMRLELHDGLFEGANAALEIVSTNPFPNILINGGTFVPSI